MNNNPEISPTCRAERSRRVITDEFAICLTDNPDCPHQIAVAGRRLCFHACRQQITDQTNRTWRTPSPISEAETLATFAA